MPDPIHGVNASDRVGVASTGLAGPTGAVQSTTAAPNSPGDAAVDSADVGNTAALLERITQAASDIPTIDEARVANLQQAIAAGTFKPDPQQIAQGILGIEDALAAKGDGA